MSQKKADAKTSTGLSLDDIKRVAVTAMFADDELFERLVLKGGNALNLIHRLGTRASLDLDFSMQHDWPEDVETLCQRVGKTLDKTFRQSGYAVFDVKLEEKPRAISEDMADFWGGYSVEFKLIPVGQFDLYADHIDELRKRAVSIGQGRKFLIDMSRFEYVTGKQEAELDGYRVYVYSPEMIVCEKLRAICQQMSEYGPVIRRSRPGAARARDFIDIHVLVTTLALDLTQDRTQEILLGMFAVKKVPIALLGKISDYREFHRSDYPSVAATVAAGTQLEEFDFYFDFVLGLVGKLEALWNV